MPCMMTGSFNVQKASILSGRRGNGGHVRSTASTRIPADHLKAAVLYIMQS